MKKSICFLPQSRSLGGPASFQKALMNEAARSGICEIHFDDQREDIGAFLVIGAPRRYFFRLIKARLQGIPVVQRLNGMNWVHRHTKSDLRYWLHSEMNNLSIAIFRRFICSAIIYQSPFSQSWWERVYGKVEKPQTIIFNGTDQNLFHPAERETPHKEIQIVCAEGNLSRGLDFGLDFAVEIATALQKHFQRPVCLHIAGRLSDSARKRIEEKQTMLSPEINIEFCGVLGKNDLAQLEASSDLFFSAEINPACPNAVIEALSCGLPVIGFDTGSLKEIVGDGGIIVPYGSDPWQMQMPDLAGLITASIEVIREREKYSAAARKRAEDNYDIRTICQQYVNYCLNSK